MTSASINVAEHLARMAGDFPDRPAVHLPIGPVRTDADTPHRTITYRELNADVDAIAAGLTSISVARGTRVALMVPPGEDFFALTFALLRMAAVPVLIDPGMGLKNLGTCLAEAEPEAFIGVPKAHLARRLFGWSRKSIRVTVNVGRRRFFCTRSLFELRQHGGRVTPPTVSSDDLAAILFTSGSTGIAKGAEYTHGIFAAQVEALKQTFGIEPGEVDLCTFPLFALFGPALGMTCVVPDMDATRPATLDPHKALRQMRQWQVTNLFGSPAVVKNLSTLDAALVSASRLTSLKRVISAGAPASIPVIEAFVRMLPTGVQVFTPYGATEALPVACIGSDEILSETRHLTAQGRGVCVGRPVAGVTVQVIRISDEPIAEWSDTLLSPSGEVGEIVVRGPVVTKRYFRRDAATKLAKIVDPRTGETIHRMGDVGYFDDHGRLWFCGRKSHRVVTPTGTLFTDMVEPVFNLVGPRTALIGVTREGITHPVLIVEGASVSRDKYEGVSTLLSHPGPFPVDLRHNSKIFREKLAAWADRRLGPRWKGGPA